MHTNTNRSFTNSVFETNAPDTLPGGAQAQRRMLGGIGPVSARSDDQLAAQGKFGGPLQSASWRKWFDTLRDNGVSKLGGGSLPMSQLDMGSTATGPGQVPLDRYAGGVGGGGGNSSAIQQAIQSLLRMVR